MAKKSTTTRLAPQIVGNAGLFYVCHHLSRLGWNTLPTSRNAKGVDLICYDSDYTRMIGVQVKALSKRSPVPLGKSLDNIVGDFWIIVNNLGTTSPSAFVMLPSEVKGLAHQGVKEGKVSYWLQPKAYECDRFRNAWDRMRPGRDLIAGILAEFFGPVSGEDIRFCQRHQGVIDNWMHGLLTVSPAPPKGLQELADNLASIPNWADALKERPTDGPIIREFFKRIIAHRGRIISSAKKWKDAGYQARSES